MLCILWLKAIVNFTTSQRSDRFRGSVVILRWDEYEVSLSW